jgi:23S rRNA-intervening sequence protein
MSQRGLEQFGAYEKARALFDLVVVDMQDLKADNRCFRLIAQQVSSADSICANIEEGYGRLSRIGNTFVSSTLREVLLVRRVGATSE